MEEEEESSASEIADDSNEDLDFHIRAQHAPAPLPELNLHMMLLSPQRRASAMQACMVAFDIPLEMMVSACQGLAESSRHWQEFLLNPMFRETLLPNYLLQTLLVSLQIKSLIVLDVQTSAEETIVGMAGEEQRVESIDPRGWMCKNVATGRLFCIKPTGWVAFIDVSGVIAECSLIAFGPTALRFAETEMLFWSLDTTRLDCVQKLQQQVKIPERISAALRKSCEPFTWEALQHLCKAMHWPGLVVAVENSYFVHVGRRRRCIVPGAAAIEEMQKGAIGLLVDARLAIWRRFILCVDNVGYVGSAPARAGAAQLARCCIRHSFFPQAKAKKGWKEDVCGGANSLGGKMSGKPAVGDRVMTLRQPWLNKILDGEKTLELRSRSAKEGAVWLAVGNVIFGRAEIERCEVITLDRFLELQTEHFVPGADLPYTHTYGLWLGQVQSLPKEVSFLRLRGSCGWARVRYQATDLLLQSKPKTKQGRGQRQRPYHTAPIRLPQKAEQPGVAKTGEETRWPCYKDIGIFRQTPRFTPTIKMLCPGEDVSLPPTFGQLANQVYVSAQTLGDGACAMHATFGATNSDGILECKGARQIAAAALERAFRAHEDGAASRYVPAVQMSLWDELAVPGATNATNSMEAQLFWKVLTGMYPKEALEVQNAIKEAEACSKTSKEKMVALTEQCRKFFTEADTSIVLQLCDQLGYSAEEGEEASFETRRDGEYVKASANVKFPSDKPRKKLAAIQDKHEAFDGLRTAVFLGRAFPVYDAVLEELGKAKHCVQLVALHESLRQLQEHRIDAALRIETPSVFAKVSTRAYLATIVHDEYFFSYDELAAIAEVQRQSLVIVKDADANAFEPCAVVNVEGTAPLVVLLKDANKDGRVRSHFERLAPQKEVMELQVDGICQEAAATKAGQLEALEGEEQTEKEVTVIQSTAITPCSQNTVDLVDAAAKDGCSSEDEACSQEDRKSVV